MTTQEIANRLVQLCREGKSIQAIDELYADNIISREPKGAPVEVTTGKEAVKNNTRKWEEGVAEIHSTFVSDPVVADSHFAMVMEIDATFKANGRMKLKEVCVYEVKDGKIISDQFFYRMG